MILKILLWVVAYIIVTLVNRKIYINLQKLDSYYYPCPPAIFICFCFLVGTIVLSLIYLMEIMESCSSLYINEFFKYKSKDDDKIIKYDKEDKRGWDGC